MTFGHDKLINDLKDRDWETQRNAANDLAAIGDSRAVEPLAEASRCMNGDVGKAAAEALLLVFERLPKISIERRASILCAVCLCRCAEMKVQVGFSPIFLYYFACPKCRRASFIDNVNKVVIVLDNSTCLDETYVHDGSTLVVNLHARFVYGRLTPFDFDEIRIVKETVREIDDLMALLWKYMDDEHRNRCKTIPVYVSPTVQLSQWARDMFRDAFGEMRAIPVMPPTFAIVFDIAKLGSNAYGPKAWEAVWRNCSPREAIGAALFEGDSAATLQGMENVYLCAFRGLDPGTQRRFENIMNGSGSGAYLRCDSSIHLATEPLRMCGVVIRTPTGIDIDESAGAGWAKAGLNTANGGRKWWQFRK